MHGILIVDLFLAMGLSIAVIWGMPIADIFQVDGIAAVIVMILIMMIISSVANVVIKVSGVDVIVIVSIVIVVLMIMEIARIVAGPAVIEIEGAATQASAQPRRPDENAPPVFALMVSVQPLRPDAGKEFPQTHGQMVPQAAHQHGRHALAVGAPGPDRQQIGR